MRFYKIALYIFSFLWLAFVLMDYWQKHPIYAFNLQHFQYYDLAGILAVLGGGFVWGTKFAQQKPNKFKWLNGLSLFGIALLLVAISIQYYITKNQLNIGLGGILHALGLMSITCGATYLVVLTSHTLGHLLLNLLPIQIEHRPIEDLTNIAIGIMGLTTLLFLFGLFGGLQWYFIAPIALAILGFRWRSSLDFVQRSLIRPIHIPKNINAIGSLSFFSLLLIIGWSLLQNNLPFPRGWDALSLYVTLPSLLHDYQSLVSGYQPYNWSLFMSLGFIVFNKIEVVLLLSYLGGILSFFALFHLARTVFKLNINLALLSVAIFNLLPSIGFQSVHDQKVDLGLLFISLTIVHIFLIWIKQYLQQHSFSSFKIDPYIAWMGLLTGFAFGIKLTTLFIFFSVLAAIWFVINGKWGFLAMFALSIFAILLLKLDDTAGLRVYHLSANIVQWTMLLAGIGLTAYLFIQDKKSFAKSISTSVVYGLFFLIPVLPWIGKNYAETKRISLPTLLHGKTETPNGSIHHFQKNLKATQNQ